jgi:hypothetical protein
MCVSGLAALPLTASGTTPPQFTGGDLVVEVDQQTTTGNNLPIVDDGSYENAG